MGRLTGKSEELVRATSQDVQHVWELIPQLNPGP